MYATIRSGFGRVYTTVNRERFTGGTAREKTKMRLHTPVDTPVDGRSAMQLQSLLQRSAIGDRPITD